MIVACQLPKCSFQKACIVFTNYQRNTMSHFISDDICVLRLMSFVIVHCSLFNLSHPIPGWHVDMGNRGQTSWDKLALLAELHTHQMRILYLPNLAPTPKKCWTLVLAISPDFQHCIGWRGGRQHVFKRMAVLFPNFSCKTQIIH